jgi:hypothetical protein
MNINRVEELAQEISNLFENVPKCEVELVPSLKQIDDCYGHLDTNLFTGIRTIRLDESLTEDFMMFIRTIVHENHHAGLEDILNTLLKNGQINEDVFEMLNERSACLTEEIVHKILINFEYIQKKFNELK